MILKNKRIFYGLVIAYIIIMLAMCVIGAIPTGNNTWDKGAKIYFPYEKQIVGSEFNINGGAYSKDEIKSIELKIEPGNMTIPVEREKIFYEDEELMTLSSFTAPVSIDKDGDYKATVFVTNIIGTFEFDQIEFTVDKGIETKGFIMFSLQHVLSLLVVLAVYIVIILIYKKFPTDKNKNIIYAVISISIVLCDITIKLWLLKNGVFKASYDAFLHMCDISGPLLIILFFMKDSKNRRRIFSLMFIWGVLGAAMALLTPEMRGNVFPSFYYFNFFIKHGFIVIGVLIIGVIENYSPKMKHLPIVIATSLVIVAIIYGINRALVSIPPFEPGNYMFLSYPPTGGSAIDMLVDIFGPSPYYIIGMVVLAFVLYTLMWAGYAIGGKIKSGKNKNEQ